MKAESKLFCTLVLSSIVLSGCGGSNDTSSSTTTESSTETSTSTDITTTTTSSELIINEIVAAATDGGNDWIELYALGGSVNLADYTIVDDNVDHTPQALPEVTLAEGEFIVIQAISADDTPPDSGYYVTFKLGSDDAVTLYKDDTQVNQLDWQDGDAVEGTSYGLFADGTGSAQTLSPTPGTSNEALSEDTVTETDKIINEDAAVRINEIVAKDANDGDDWIEFYVTGSTDINLSNYSLSDSNGELVSLPDVTLSPGDYYRVYATTDSVENTETIGLKLGSSDEVNLYLGTDLIDQLSWKKGQALIGYSYGRYPDGSDGTRTLTPTPVATNQIATKGPLLINEIVANDANDGYDWFELYNNSAENISLANYQVIDESNDIEPVNLPSLTLAPGEYTVIYATDTEIDDNYVPFKLGNTDELNLLLNGEIVDYIDWVPSDVTKGFSYGLKATTSSTNNWAKGFLTPTPGEENELASAFNSEKVNDLYINISTENWQDILDNPMDEVYHDTSITLNGVTLDSVAIRTKGGSSLRSVAQSTSDRYSFKIDINKYVDGQKFFGLKKFTLQNSFNDPSYMREVIAYDLLDEMGVETPEHSFVDVYVNGELFGLYLMVEAVDGEFIENHFDNANGDLYKPDGVGSDLLWIDDDITSYSDLNLQSNEDTTDNGAFINFVEQLSNGSTDVIAVDPLLRYLSVSVALSNLDSYHGPLAHNYYLYEQDGNFNLLPWDFNESFGSFNMGCRTDVRELYIDEPTSGALSDRPMVANVFANQDNLDTYHNYLWQLINGPLSDETFAARINAIADLIDDHVANDPSKFYTYDQFQQNLTTTVDRFFGLTEFMSYRINNMTQQLNGELPSSNNGNGFCN